MKQYILSGGALLGASALVSKFLGLWRDRLIVNIFSEESADLIYIAFRIPDFFFYLLVGATVSVIFLPKIVDLKEKEKTEYFSSLLWGVFVFFGLLSTIGIIFAETLVHIFASGIAISLQKEIVDLARLLFGSVFILAVSSVFASMLQSQEKFLPIAIAPLL